MAEQDPPGGGPAPDPFTDWYKNTIQAHPERYDPAHFTEGQARAWYPLWDASSGGFRSSKVDRQGNPIQGNTFAHPDECPPGTTAYGQNQCVPVNEIPGQRGGQPAQGLQGADSYRFGGGSFGGGSFGSNFGLPNVPEFKPPNLTDDPGYQFRLSQGIKGMESSAAARGVLNTGGTLQGITDYGQNLASQEYGNAFQRYKDQYAPQLAQWNRNWDQYQFGSNDQFRRQAWESDDQFRRRQSQLDDEYRKQVMILQSQPPGGY